MNLPAISRKDALRIYAHSLQIQESLQAKVIAEPAYRLSFEETLQYLDSLRKEQHAQLHILESFQQE